MKIRLDRYKDAAWQRDSGGGLTLINTWEFLVLCIFFKKNYGMTVTLREVANNWMLQFFLILLTWKYHFIHSKLCICSTLYDCTCCNVFWQTDRHIHWQYQSIKVKVACPATYNYSKFLLKSRKRKHNFFFLSPKNHRNRCFSSSILDKKTF